MIMEIRWDSLVLQLIGHHCQVLYTAVHLWHDIAYRAQQWHAISGFQPPNGGIEGVSSSCKNLEKIDPIITDLHCT